MNKLFVFILLICACNTMQAQLNFIRNGSFEQHSSCPNNFDQIKYAFFWNSIDTTWSPGDTITPGHPAC